jgi:uncharacterized repeat protein (TIGR01451 family)
VSGPGAVTVSPGGKDLYVLIGNSVARYRIDPAKIAAPATVRHGSALTYTIRVLNAGPSGAWQAELTDHLPAGTAFRTAAAASGQCSSPKAGARGATVRFRLAKLKTGATWRIQIKVTVKASHGTIRDQATAGSVTPTRAPATTPRPPPPR